MDAVVWTHYRMNDYVGPGIFATVTWAGPCSKPGGHILGGLSNVCVRCQMRPTIEYDRKEG